MLMKSFAQFAGAGHGVIVGQPGSGKTHTLSRFASALLEQKRTCLYLPLDKLGVSDVSDLRDTLGVSDDLIQYLRNQSGTTDAAPGFLIVDAFDAARSETSQRQFLNLIRRAIEELGANWHVLVSVRTYDAQKSGDLLEMFPPHDAGTEFVSLDIRCRHFFIPQLTDSERSEAVSSVPELAEIFESGSLALKELLRNPFNIWLMEQLILGNARREELSGVQSEIGLLGLFWEMRVARGRSGEARQIVAARVAKEMVESFSLAIRKDRVFDPAHQTAWQELLSTEVLITVGTTGQRVSYGHNILFDYAVSVLLIDDEPDALEAFLQADKSRPLFLRPSLNYYFSRLWHSNATVFWRVFWHVLQNQAVHIRLFARLLAPTVVARELRDPALLAPLLEHRRQKRDETDQAILRLIQALRSLGVERDAVWLDVFCVLSEDCSPVFISDMASYTSTILERAIKNGDKTAQGFCGVISRNLLGWIWGQRSTDLGKRFERLGSSWILPMVAKTFGTDPVSARKVLEPVLALVKEKDFPIDYIYWLTHDLKHIWPYDAEFVEQVYFAVFENPETSEARTDMGTPVLPMSSTRRQDYSMCHYNLKEGFPSFVHACPEVASRTAIRCLNPYILRSHIVPYLEEGTKLNDLAKEFDFRGGKAVYIPDHNYLWSQIRYPEEPVEIADALFAHLSNLADNPSEQELVNRLLDVFRDHVCVAYFWAQLLMVGSEHPKAFGSRLYELCLAKPVQIHSDTIYQLGSFLATAYDTFSFNQKKTLEHSILALTGTRDDQDADIYVQRRNQLISCIPITSLVTPEAQQLSSQLQAANATLKNEPVARFEVTSKVFPDDYWLIKKGADLKKPANLVLKAFLDPMGKFVSESQNKHPSMDAVSSIMPTLHAAWKSLEGVGNADQAVVDALWCRVAECAKTAARGIENPASEEFTLCREILLQSTTHSDPKPNEEYDSKYSYTCWSSAPRNEAAQGLPWLAVWKAQDEAIVAAIRKLASDPVPSVRFLVVTELWRLNRYYLESCWAIMEEVATQERNRVVQQALCHSVGNLIGKYEQKSCSVLKHLLAAIEKEKEGSEFLDSLVNLIMWLVVVRENPWAISVADEFLKDPERFARALDRANLDVLSYLTPSNMDDDKMRRSMDRAKSWIFRAIDSASGVLKKIVTLTPEKITEELRAKVRTLYSVIDQVVMRLYFAAGLFEKSKHHPPVSSEQRKRFYDEIKPLLEHVIEVSDHAKGGVLFASTAHHFMELLNGVLTCDPKGVLHMANRVATIAKGGGYNFDSLAVREVAKLVESILANHRIDVRDPNSLENLLGLLDIFADVGWVEALNLVWRLDEIFR
jgi:hypothetical protein